MTPMTISQTDAPGARLPGLSRKFQRARRQCKALYQASAIAHRGRSYRGRCWRAANIRSEAERVTSE